MLRSHRTVPAAQPRSTTVPAFALDERAVGGTGHLGGDLIKAGQADVGRTRESQRRHRLWVIATVLALPTSFLWFRILSGSPFDVFNLPTVDPFLLTIILFFGLMAAIMLASTVGAGRSPHVTYRPEQISVRLDDVKGVAGVKEDVIRSLNLFLAHKTFRDSMGGTPRRGLLFEGAPGTGKTHLAKAMAAEAGVPFLFVSATSFQSMFYGATARKIRSYFKQLRKVARAEGGAIGFIEEIDAIAMSRAGVNAMTFAPDLARASAGCHAMCALPATYGHAAVSNAATVSHAMTSEGTGGVVNELLVQMQSFDDPTGLQKLTGKMIDGINLLLPPHRQFDKAVPAPVNVLLIAATNRADNLDPALLRPGRFDRRLTFDLPSQAGRRELIDHFLARKTHEPELDTDELRDTLAGITQGYTPVMIEHLLDEALVNAVRRGAAGMSWSDLEKARMVEEIGMGQPVAYTAYEKKLIATHEAGHATMAYLVAGHRRLEILTIIKRRSALGMLAHGDTEEVFTRSKSELSALIQIAMGGQVAEELFFGDISTGPAGDLLYATNVAAEMIGSAGMGDSLVSFAAMASSTNMVGRVLSDSDGREAVDALLHAQRDTARTLLGANRHLVEALRDALLEREELIGREITDVLAAAGPVRAAEPVTPVATPAVIDLTDPALKG